MSSKSVKGERSSLIQPQSCPYYGQQEQSCVGELSSLIQLQSCPYYPTKVILCRRAIISDSTSILPLLSTKSNRVLDVKCMNSTMSTDLILNHHQEGRMFKESGMILVQRKICVLCACICEMLRVYY